MRRISILLFPVTCCFMSSGCITTGELNEKVAELRRENARVVADLERRVADLQQCLDETQTLSLDAIQQESDMRAGEQADLRRELSDVETSAATRLVAQANAWRASHTALKDQLAATRRDLSARMDVEALAQVDEEKQLRAKCGAVEEKLALHVESVATARQQNRDLVVAALADLDRDLRGELGGQLDTHAASLAGLAEEVAQLGDELQIASNDAQQRLREAQSETYAALDQSQASLRLEIENAVAARKAGDKAIASRLTARCAVLADKLVTIEQQLREMPSQTLARKTPTETNPTADQDSPSSITRRPVRTPPATPPVETNEP